MWAYVDGVTVGAIRQATGWAGTLNFVVPALSSYRVTDNGCNALWVWSELS